MLFLAVIPSTWLIEDEPLRRSVTRVVTRRYGMLTSMGYSLLQAMGFRYHGSNKLLYLSLSAALGLPFVPLLPWLPDFMMVMARKK